MEPFKSFAHDRAGQFGLVAAVATLPLVASVGLAVTYAGAILSRDQMQHTLDAAVLAGTTLGHSASESMRLDRAYSVTGITPLTFGGDPKVDIAIGDDITFQAEGTTVIGYAAIKMTNPFSRIVGEDFIEIGVSARAEKRSSEPVCLLALNKSEPATIQAYGNAELTATNCTAMANSTSGEAIKQFGAKSSISATRLGVTGSFAGKNIKPVPETDIEPMADPYGTLPVPKAGACIVMEKLSKSQFTLEPGTYCGGLNISPGAEVRLNRGIYIIKDGPLAISANSKLTGDEVMIAFVGGGSTLNSNAGSEITLTSPTTGTYANIQFMSDRKADGQWKGQEWFTLSSSTLTFDGAMYLPEQDLWVKGSSVINAKSPGFAMIGDQFWIQDASEVRISQENTRGVTSGWAGAGFKYSARLAE